MASPPQDQHTQYRFNTGRDRPYATHLLVYLAHLVRQQPHLLEFTNSIMMGGYQQWDYDTQDDDEQPSYAFELGEGVHRVPLESGVLLKVDVTISAGRRTKGEEDVDYVNDIITFNMFNCTAINKQITISGLNTQSQIDALLKAASTHVAALLRQEQPNKRRVSNFVFDCKETHFVRLGYVSHRESQSIFLKEGEFDSLFGLVGDFLASKDDYERCSVPYKLNLLLHGVPGAGKTSVIKTLACHFALNIAIIPFSPDLTDDVLAKALVKANAMGCRLIALEDVDCIFDQSPRKPKDLGGASLTLSGLLNCMDGMLRGSTKGLIMVLTANMVHAIDEAILRTARMDFALEFTHADQFQTKACFDFYARISGFVFTEDEWLAFWEAISCHQFTTALLQQFFFHSRKHKPLFLDAERFKRLMRTTGKEGIIVQQQTANTMGFYT